MQGGTEAQAVQAVQAAQRCRRHSRGATRLRRRGAEVQGRRGADLHARRQRLKRLHASLPLGRRGRTVDAQAAHALGGSGLLHCVEHHLQSVQAGAGRAGCAEGCRQVQMGATGAGGGASTLWCAKKRSFSQPGSSSSAYSAAGCALAVPSSTHIYAVGVGWGHFDENEFMTHALK